jgi:hypothetical protein
MGSFHFGSGSVKGTQTFRTWAEAVQNNEAKAYSKQSDVRHFWGLRRLLPVVSTDVASSATSIEIAGFRLGQFSTTVRSSEIWWQEGHRPRGPAVYEARGTSRFGPL